MNIFGLHMRTGRSNELLAYAVTAISVVGASLISPIIPDIIEDYKISPGLVTTLISFFVMPMIVFTPIIGVLGERFSVKDILLASLVVFLAGGVICFYAQTFEILLFGRIIQGCGSASLELLGIVLLIKSVEKQMLYAAISRNASVIGLSTALTPLISGLIASVGWKLPFLSALLVIPIGVSASFLLKRQTNTSVAVNVTDVKTFLFDKNIIFSFILTFFAFFYLFGLLLSFVPILVSGLGVKRSYLVALFPTVSAISIFCFAPVFEKKSSGISEHNAALIGFVLYFLSMLSIALCSFFGIWMVLLGCLLLGAAHGVVFPLAQNIMGRKIPHFGHALFMSFGISVIGLSQTLSPFITSGVFTLLGSNVYGVFAFGAVISLVGIIVLHFWSKLTTSKVGL